MSTKCLWVLHVVPFSEESHLPEDLVSSEHALPLSVLYKSAGTRQTIARCATSSAYSLYVGRTKCLERFDKTGQISYLVCSETFCWDVSVTLFVTGWLLLWCLHVSLRTYCITVSVKLILKVCQFYIACPVKVEMIIMGIDASGFTVNSAIHGMSAPNNCICCEDCLYINKHSAGVIKKC